MIIYIIVKIDLSMGGRKKKAQRLHRWAFQKENGNNIRASPGSSSLVVLGF